MRRFIFRRWTSDPRIRGSRVGQLAANGSYWAPARIDLDTILSKIDSRIIQDMVVVKGPYSVRYGPGLDFIDVELLRSPRYDGPTQVHGGTSFDYQANGEQWYGRQTLMAGGSNWGVRAGYGHRTGNASNPGTQSLIGLFGKPWQSGGTIPNLAVWETLAFGRVVNPLWHDDAVVGDRTT